MIHPATALRFVNDVVGQGVFATARIPRGTVTWAQDALDQMLTVERVRRLGPDYAPILRRTTFLDAAGNAVLCWDWARYVNHSCRPNCAGTDLGFEVALEDILPGQQLTNDYATFRLIPEEEFDCLCGSSHCRRRVTSHEADVISAGLRQRIEAALCDSPQVPQPLQALLRPNWLARI